jgi:dipeptidyl aminopeptidase/acylaminoacyl peptidase
MTSPRRFESELPALLTELYPARTLDYRDDLVRQTARVRQRPAWTFPERWLPMAVVTRRPVFAPTVPWRTLGVLALIGIFIAAALAAYVGSQPRRPAPFGVAANGQVAYAERGDIYTVDPLTGVASAVVTGSENDLAPVWSRDGTRFVFQRMNTTDVSTGQIYVARADGQELVAVTPKPLQLLGGYAFSPDGREVLFTTGHEGNLDLWVAKADGSGIRQIDVGMSVVDPPSYRPPNGAEIVFTGGQQLDGGQGLYAVDVATNVVRTILAPVQGVGRGLAKVSPDGSRIAYSLGTVDPNRNTYRVHVVAADGSGDMTLPMPEGATFQDAPAWSNDGRDLAVVRGYAEFNQEIALAVVPVDGSGFGIETDRGLTGCCDTVYEWAPDDTTILIKPFDLHGQPLPPLLWNPLTGATSRAPWAAISDPAWQRIAR